MPAFPFVTLDVFTDRRFGGNPLAVFTDARGLSDAQMQSLAAEMNLSETTFVLPPEDPVHTARVRIFNRTAEMPFAGHPSVGTGFILAGMGRDDGGALTLEVPAGLVQVEITRDAAGAPVGGVIAAPRPLALGPELPTEVAAACASLEAADIVVSNHRPVAASVGVNFFFAEVEGEALGRASPNWPRSARPPRRRGWWGTGCRCTSTPATEIISAPACSHLCPAHGRIPPPAAPTPPWPRSWYR